MRKFNAALAVIAVTFWLVSVGCERTNQHDSSHPTSTNSLADAKGDTPVRYLCTYCGAWREADPVKLIVSLSEGAKPGSADERAIADAKKTEGPFMIRHLEKCGLKGGMVVAVYPDDPKWKKLDKNKQEK